MDRKKIVRNIATTLLLQLVAVANGLIVPQIFISIFGSETNGLVTSITQLLNYVSLLEGGLSGVVMASLYKPLRENDHQRVSAIVNATRRFFKQIGVIYIVYTIAVAVIYPLVIKTELTYTYVMILTLVLAVNLFVQYFFSITYQILIRAAQRGYVTTLTKAGTMLLNIVLVVVLTKLFPDLIFVKAAGALVLFLQPVVYAAYTKKHFQLDRTVPSDDNAIKERWSGFGHMLAYFINTNVGVLLLTAFSTLSAVSVYAVYLMITNAIRNLSVAIASAVMPSLGDVMAAGDKDKSNKAFSTYEFGMAYFTTLLFTCGVILLIPFVSVYTANFTDAQYIQPVFGILLMAAETIFCFREPYINAAYAAGHFKQTVKYAWGEVVIHVSIALLLVHKFDLIGIALGFLVAVAYRTVAHVLYLKKNILYRPIRKFVKISALFLGTALALVAAANLWLPLDEIDSYFQWFQNAVIVFCGTALALGLVSVIAFREELKSIIRKKAKR